MKACLILFCLVAAFAYVNAVENYLEHPVYNCIKCLCHARTGCWRRQNCASYSISRKYWEEAGSLTVGSASTKGGDAYRRCMGNENCIVGTIINYTNKCKAKDCNCDGKFDCKDRMAIHLFGEDCVNPKFTYTYARRFNECAAAIGVKEMLPEEGNETCQGPMVE